MSKLEHIHKFLVENQKTLALAESCTGGHLAAKFTALPGASSYLLGSLVTYSDEFKRHFLHVKQETLSTCGAVSREVATEMFLGIMLQAGADYGIAITGIAGPSGGTREKPIGTAFIAYGRRGEKPHVEAHSFKGNRESVIEAACETALTGLGSILE